jgi:hypothetical protein
MILKKRVAIGINSYPHKIFDLRFCFAIASRNDGNKSTHCTHSLIFRSFSILSLFASHESLECSLDFAQYWYQGGMSAGIAAYRKRDVPN